MARPTIEINTEELEKLCTLQCTQPEIASWFGVTTRTIEKRVADTEKTYPHPVGDRREIMDLTFKEIMERGYAVGRISLRRRQFQLAEGGNAAMAIFLGKNLLGQRDNLDTVVSGVTGVVIDTNASNSPGQLLRSRIDSLAERLAKSGDTGRTN